MVKKCLMKLNLIVVVFLLLFSISSTTVSAYNFSVSGQAAILIEQESGRVLYEKDAHRQLRIASITKIMTAILAIESGKMDEMVTVSSNAFGTEGSSLYLRLGEKIKLRDLVYGLMLRSGNDAAVAIAEHVGGSLDGFVYLMNEKAHEIGMYKTVFNNPHGLDDHEEHYSTAYDMADEHRIPGLNWYKVDEDRYIDYGTSIEKTLKLTPKQSFEDSLYHLNNTHLNPNVPTIHEELHQKGFTTGSVNFIMYRGHKSHPVYIPPYIQEPLNLPESMQTNGPDLLAFGQLVKPKALKEHPLPESVFHKLGLNDEYSVEATKALIKAGEQPDFLTVFLPDFDRDAHEHSIHYLKGFERAEAFFQEILNSYESWEKALEENIFIVLGDHGSDTLLDNDVELTIDLEEIYEGLAVAPLGEKVSQYDLGFANNHRMSYVYAPNNPSALPKLAETAMMDDRIALASWVNEDWIHVTSPDYNTSFRFKPGNTYRDRYDQGWDIEGDERIVSVKIEGNQLKYADYPDVFNQLQSALYSHDIPTLVLAAKPSYQFYSEGAPVHEGGGEHGGIHANDTLASIIIAGTDKKPEKLRIVDLKDYILGLFE